MSDPVVTVEFEFFFTSGAYRRVDVLEGRDRVTRGNNAIQIERVPDEHTIERTEVHLSSVECQVVTQRTTPA
jgi:hypothetical protein